MPAVREYDGTPQYIKGAPAPAKRDGLKKTLRGTIKTFRDLGDKFMNAIDYERTMHLPVGQGRLACDPETGDFDEDTPRRPYNPAEHSPFPMHLHSTITEGEHIEVRNEEEKQRALATRKWSEKPLEKKKRFTLTPEDQLVNLKGQVEAERAGRLEMERRMEAVLERGPDGPETATLLAKQLEEEKQSRLALEARVEQLLTAMQNQMNKPTSTTSEIEDEGEVEATNVRKRKVA